MVRAPRPRVGAMIKQRRQQLGMKTQAALAARIQEQTSLRVSRTTVANWEADIHYPERYMGALEAVLGPLDAAPDAQEERYRDLGRDRGGMLDPHEVDILIEDYRRRRAPETRAG